MVATTDNPADLLADPSTQCTSCGRTNCPCGSLCECRLHCRCIKSLLEQQLQQKKLQKKRSNDGAIRIELQIDGMTCSMCSSAVEKAIKFLNEEKLNEDFILSCNVNPINGIGIVEVSREKVQDDADGVLKDVCNAVEDIGYDCEGKYLNLRSSYAASASNNNNEDSERNIGADYLIDDDDEDSVSEEGGDLEENLIKEEKRNAAIVREKRDWFLKSLIGSLPIFFLTMIYPYFSDTSDEVMIVSGLSVQTLIMWILSTFVQFYCGWIFYKGAWKSVKARALGMDMLVALGTSAAYFYAVLLIIMDIAKIGEDNESDNHGSMNHGDGEDHGSKGAHFFETSAVLISFVFLGHWLQAMAVRKTSGALVKLIRLQSKTAIVVEPNDAEELELSLNLDNFDPSKDYYLEKIVPTKDLKRGQIIKVTRGSSIPTDCKLISGSISVNEAAMTGESVPTLKTCEQTVDENSDKQQHLIGGTICVEGLGFARVTKVGSQTALAQIISMIRNAQSNSAPIQDFADYVSSIFVPCVVVISLITFLTWLFVLQFTNADIANDEGYSHVTLSLLFAISVLVISCPCALGLATPTAIMVGTGVGAANGILIKGGEALQSASKISCVIFDKTGTMTIGEPSVNHVYYIESNLETDLSSDKQKQHLLWCLATLERNSEHPLAHAIVKYVEKQIPDYIASNPLPQPDKFIAVTGKGTSCTIKYHDNKDERVSIGNQAYMSMLNISLSDTEMNEINKMSEQGLTAVLCAIDNHIKAVVGLSDVIRSDAVETVKRLRNMNIEVWMVTGDNKRTALTVAHEIGIELDKVVSEALPSTKVDIVKKLQGRGHKVAMVGDGINDSPALFDADIGIAISGGNAENKNVEIAAEAADLVIINQEHSVWHVHVALHLTRIIFRRIKINYLWALIYNSLGIPIAAGIFYPVFGFKLEPILASVAMALSSISVILSSLTLKLYNAPKFS